MADIELVIKIPDYTYTYLCKGGNTGAPLMIDNAIKNGTPLPPVQPKAKWIPVSERLPKENERCLCSYKDEEGECIDLGLFKDGAWYVKGVVAWMPLPEPYKESED